ncbi:ABC transporter ATP-binding protein [Hominifimenecus sp. rT4P-3]|uniref:ABC transporter ATP-binding protein n=1 Tax=Hominifimenecus sp. rT4P-3 TaxID=3242979 RepID=UPI003DA63F6C
MEKKNGNDILLTVDDLEVQYTAGGEIIKAVNGVSFQVKRGQTFGLVGETGAGKTTIAKSILRILPDPPAKIIGGTVKLEGKDLMAISEKEMRSIRGEKIAMIFQDPMTALNPVFPVGDQIAEAIKTHEKISKKKAYEKTVELLEMVGIPAERYEEYPHQFSGGMKQRVVIAMALACNPELILADEPTTALDVTIQAQVLEMIGKLKREKNTSMIMITHDLGVVAEVCDEVAVVYAGQIVEAGTLEDIYDHPTHPYTLGLFSSIPSLTGDETRLKPIAGMPPNPADLPKGCYFAPRCPHADECCRREGQVGLVEITPGHVVRCLKAGKGE